MLGPERFSDGCGRSCETEWPSTTYLPVLCIRDADLNLNRNTFIQTALSYTLSYIANISNPLITPASVTIYADNDYYSTPAELPTTPGQRFYNFGVPLSQAHKTGLGSSAALVTAFTAALLTYYLPKETFDLSTDLAKRRLHNLAQAAHCAAQGKVGSGFDVASAVYGSCLYRRFSPSILSNHVEPGTAGFAADLRDIVDETGRTGAWDTEVLKDAVKVPKRLRLVMCDVSCGSETPGMVKKVLAWRKANPEEAEKLWSELQQANENLAHELRMLAEDDSSSSPDYSGLKKCFRDIRQGIRTMSAASDVPIEPKAQTTLLDACEAIPGVIGGVVPGAGGYDAIALLIEDHEQTVEGLRQLFAGWKFDTSDTESSGKVSMLRVREEMQGVKAEDPGMYSELRVA